MDGRKRTSTACSKRRRRGLGLIAVCAAGALGWASPAQAVQIKVDNDKVQCPTAKYTTVQAAVNAAQAGDEIRICPGTYREQVTIARNNLKVVSDNPANMAIIEAPATPLVAPFAIVHVRRATGVQIRGIAITGPGPGTCDSLQHGVLVREGANVLINSNRIQEIRDEPYGSCNTGSGVTVEKATAKITQNVIDRNQSNGIFANGPGTVVEIDQNGIAGMDTPGVNEQVGVNVQNGTKATVTRNEIRANRSAPPNEGYPGEGVFAGGIAKNSTFANNHVHDNGAGMRFVDMIDVLVQINRVTANETYGILVDFPASANRFYINDARGNGFTVDGFGDCTDRTRGNATGGISNIWSGNRGLTSFPAVICRK